MKKTMKMGACLSLLAGIKALDGHVVILQEEGQDDSKGKPQGKPHKKFYKFSSAGTLGLAKNLFELQKVEALYHVASNQLITALTDGSGRLTDEQRDRLQVQLAELVEASEHEIDLTKIDIKELQVVKNEIPHTALGPIMEIIEMPEEEEA